MLLSHDSSPLAALQPDADAPVSDEMLFGIRARSLSAKSRACRDVKFEMHSGNTSSLECKHERRGNVSACLVECGWCTFVG